MLNTEWRTICLSCLKFSISLEILTCKSPRFAGGVTYTLDLRYLHKKKLKGLGLGILVAILRDDSVRRYVPQTIPLTSNNSFVSCVVERHPVPTKSFEIAHHSLGQNDAFSVGREQLVGLSFEDNHHHRRFLQKKGTDDVPITHLTHPDSYLMPIIITLKLKVQWLLTPRSVDSHIGVC